MSAYVVDRAVIDALVTAAVQWSRPGESFSWLYNGARRPWLDGKEQQGPNWWRLLSDPAHADRVGAGLWAENVRSVNYRASVIEPIPVYRWIRTEGVAPPVFVLKLLAEYEYQTCECPDWMTAGSEAAQFCDALRRTAIRQLPGYDLSVRAEGRMAFLHWASAYATQARGREVSHV